MMLIRSLDRSVWVLGAALGALLTIWASPARPGDDTSGIGNDQDGTNWPSYGRTHSENHASPLTSINAGNVRQLGLAWSLELPDVHNGATMPLEVDGVLYFTVDQSKVHAVEALTGKLLWQYDPRVGEVAGEKLRYTWGPRGIAYWKGKVYVGTTDGRLIAIDAKTGRPVWSTLTVERNDTRTITGAPRAFDGMVIIGHAGADSGPQRGYVTAYRADTGQQVWRFYTVPGNPADGFESAALAMAAKTWTGEWWKYGGGGTVWDGITYDPELDAVYFGTGNGTPWNRKVRSPGGGDNLFATSLVALDAKTGRYKWHYQENPGDTWDFDSTMGITLATLKIDGKPRKVLLQAPKNGFFYVIDRTDGKLISAQKYGKVTWADHIDLATGRPVEFPAARYPNGEAFVSPASSGAHSWPPQSFNSKTGLVYIPTLSIPGYFNDKTIDPKTWSFKRGQTNLGVADYIGDIPKDIGTSALLAWDPVRQKEVWSVKTPGFWNGGTMTTLGNLVFEGQANGDFVAYAADSGTKLWSFYCAMGITGAPITYSVNGRQYVSVVAGWGGGGAGYLGSLAAQHGWVARVHQHRLLTFTLGGQAQLPANLPPPQFVVPIDDPKVAIDPEKAKQGGVLYSRTCVTCHGSGVVASGFAPDLRASTIPLSAETFERIVRGGLPARGMPQFGELSPADLDNIRAYIRQRARETLAASHK
jgi:quinohemoprotein ethanol dehydrogenase